MEVSDANFDNTGQHFPITAFGQTVRSTEVQGSIPMTTMHDRVGNGGEARGGETTEAIQRTGMGMGDSHAAGLVGVADDGVKELVGGFVGSLVVKDTLAQVHFILERERDKEPEKWQKEALAGGIEAP